MFCKIREIALCIIGLMCLQVSHIFAAERYAVAIKFDEGVTDEISKLVPTDRAVRYARDETNRSDAIYFIERNRSQSYHMTLGLYSMFPTNLSKFKGALGASNFQKYAAVGYELRLFVRFGDGDYGQYNLNGSKTCKRLDYLRIDANNKKGVSFANIVLKVGVGTKVETNGYLSDAGILVEQWSAFKNRIANNTELSRKFRIIKDHDLETHVTIASLYKYDKNIYQLQRVSRADSVVVRKDGTNDKCFNMPFTDDGDIDRLLNIFFDTDRQFQERQRPMPVQLIQQLHITQKTNAGIMTVDTVNLP